MIAFIDTEVNPQTKKGADYGAVREDGAVLHSSSKADFDAFVSKCDTVCGHNIINFDLKYTSLRGNSTIVRVFFTFVGRIATKLLFKILFGIT